MSLRKIIDWSITEASGDLTGTIASPFYQFFDSNGSWTWACDVDIGKDQPLRNVPVANNNRDIIYAQVGMPVALKRQVGNNYAIVGLSKTTVGDTHIIYMRFGDAFGQVTGTARYANVYRPLTYGELANYYGGYGNVPYGSIGRFDANGDLVELIRSY